MVQIVQKPEWLAYTILDITFLIKQSRIAIRDCMIQFVSGFWTIVQQPISKIRFLNKSSFQTPTVHLWPALLRFLPGHFHIFIWHGINTILDITFL